VERVKANSVKFDVARRVSGGTLASSAPRPCAHAQGYTGN
jgi:hypothetical protein